MVKFLEQEKEKLEKEAMRKRKTEEEEAINRIGEERNYRFEREQEVHVEIFF